MHITLNCFGVTLFKYITLYSFGVLLPTHAILTLIVLTWRIW